MTPNARRNLVATACTFARAAALWVVPAVALALIPSAGSVAAPVAPTAPSAQVDNAAEQVARIAEAQGAQTELPEQKSETDPSPLFAGSLPLAKVLLYLGWLVAIALVLLLIAWGIQHWIDGRRLPRGQKSAGGSGTLPVWAQGELGDPDELARAGRYTEAIHALLLLALRRLMRDAGGSFSDSLTSREVVRRLEMPPVRRGSMLQLIHASEVAWFGGVEADDSRFIDCRRLFERALGKGEA